MKFCKRYEEYMQGKEKELPGVGLKKLKKILKKCRREFKSQDQMDRNPVGDGDSIAQYKCPDECSGFFPSLLKKKKKKLLSFL